MVLECEDCSCLVDAEVLHSYSYDASSGDSYQLSLARCPNCNSPFLASQLLDFDGLLSPFRMYPAHADRVAGSLPKPIRAAFEEAVTCIRAKAYTAAAIMCRKTLEGICSEHGVKERNLARSLEKLRDTEVIDKRLFEWADSLRLFGNDAAHEVSVVINARDARDILDFTRALIEYVFTFRERFAQFQKRHAAAPVVTA